jgi:hypothetical protein
VGPRAGLDRCGKSRPPTGIRSPDCPARSQSLYRLSYPALRYSCDITNQRRARWKNREFLVKTNCVFFSVTLEFMLTCVASEGRQ